MALTPPTLRGRFVTLEPLEERHAADVFAAMQDEEVCRYLAWPPPAKLEETLALIREARDVMTRRKSVQPSSPATTGARPPTRNRSWCS